MGVNQRRQLHPLHLFEQQRNVVDALRDDVGYLVHSQSLAQFGIYLQIWANRELKRTLFRLSAYWPGTISPASPSNTGAVTRGGSPRRPCSATPAVPSRGGPS